MEHYEKHHPGEEPNFSMKVTKKCKTPLERQAWEGFKIENFQGRILNKKGKWGQNLAPRLVLEEESKIEIKTKRKRN